MIEPKKAVKNASSENKYPDIEWRLKLDKNENVYEASKFVVSALKNFDGEKIHLYPDYSGIIEKLSIEYNLNQKNILLTNDDLEAINLVINTYLDKDEEIIFLNPDSNKLKLIAETSNGTILYYDKEKLFELEKIRNNVTSKTKIFYLSTPDKVTGQAIQVSSVLRLLEEYPNILFVVDISYVNFAQNIDIMDFIDLIENYSNIALIKSFSSDYALAGLGGAVLLSNFENIKNLKILSLPNSVNAVSVKCMFTAIKDKEYFEKIKEQNLAVKKYLIENINNIGFRAYNSEANFILCDFGDNLEFYYNKFKNHGIITAKFPFNPNFSTCLRITVPKESGAKFILELLKPKDLLIFSLDNTLINPKKSYEEALVKTFEHFSKFKISYEKIKETKYLLKSSYFEAIKNLLEENYISADIFKIKEVFENIFYNPKIPQNDYLINNDELIIPKEILERLSINYDIAVVSERKAEEVEYSLKKTGIENLISYIQAESFEIEQILKKCSYKKAKLLSSELSAIHFAKTTKAEVIGFVYEDNNDNNIINNFKHFGVDEIILNKDEFIEYFGLFS